MGSLEGFVKGQQPMLGRVRQNIACYNNRSAWIASRTPLWRKLLAKLPNPKQPAINWNISVKRYEEWDGFVRAQIKEVRSIIRPPHVPEEKWNEKVKEAVEILRTNLWTTRPEDKV